MSKLNIYLGNMSKSKQHKMSIRIQPQGKYFLTSAYMTDVSWRRRPAYPPDRLHLAQLYNDDKKMKWFF